jgi:hypothetical protein
MEDKIKDINELIEKVDQMKKKDKMDLSSDEDLSIAIMNLISIEEHLFFSGAKTEKHEYYDLINEVRTMRKQLLKKMIKEYEGEVWCISKHLLASSMRLMEVGTKQLDMGKKEEAYDLFDKAYDLYALFWGLNMKLITSENVKKLSLHTNTIDDNDSNSNSTIKPELISTKKGVMGALGKLVKMVIDCCIE